MALSQEEINELKSQLKKQIENLPPDKKKEAEAHIDSMSPEALEIMLNEQQIQARAPKIFRMIVEKKIPSIIIGENSGAIAVLSTKSISKGHALIIPKTPIQSEKDIPKEVHDLSQEISKKILSSLKAKSTTLIPEKNFGEVILNIIPIYDFQLDLSSPRIETTLEELKKIKKEIEVIKIKKEPKEKIKQKKPKTRPIKLSRRIP